MNSTFPVFGVTDYTRKIFGLAAKIDGIISEDKNKKYLLFLFEEFRRIF